MISAAAAIALSISSGLAAPVEQTPSVFIPTQKTSSGLDLPFYYPPVTFKAFSTAPQVADRTTSPGNDDKQDAEFGKNTLAKELGLSTEQIEITEFHRDSAGVLHVYTRELVNNIPIDNRNAAIHIQNHQVVAISSSFTKSKPVSPAAPVQRLGLSEAVKIAEEKYSMKRDEHPATNVFIQAPDNSLIYGHQFQLRDDRAGKWIQVTVDAKTGAIVQAVDYVNDATFKVISLPNVDPTQGFKAISSPELTIASPSGWNSDGTTTYTDTQGNNVFSAISGKTAEGGKELDFSTNWQEKQDPTSVDNKRAAIINNFYVSNMMHDISYAFGFDEASGNFQQKNFGKGGAEGDRVVIKNQAYGSNNANFATPPDGQSGVMQMYLWNKSNPKRDGSLENDVPMHEYTHGISNRLTGGSRQGNCLQTTTSRGMGEGWSDTLAIYLTRSATMTKDDDAVLGAYVYNKAAGIRSKPYSTSMERNPYTFSYVGTQNEVHAIGEFWALCLFEMYWSLVDAKGVSSNWYDATQEKGSTMAFQLVMGGFKLQPCNPTFITARDAILAADQAYYKGANKCLIWKAFAKRGLGTDAEESSFTDGFKLPEECN